MNVLVKQLNRKDSLPIPHSFGINIPERHTDPDVKTVRKNYAIVPSLPKKGSGKLPDPFILLLAMKLKKNYLRFSSKS